MVGSRTACRVSLGSMRARLRNSTSGRLETSGCPPGRRMASSGSRASRCGSRQGTKGADCISMDELLHETTSASKWLYTRNQCNVQDNAWERIYRDVLIDRLRSGSESFGYHAISCSSTATLPSCQRQRRLFTACGQWLYACKPSTMVAGQNSRGRRLSAVK